MTYLTSQLRALIKLYLFIIIIFFYFVSASIIYFFNYDLKKRRQKLILNTQFFCKLLLIAYDVKLICKNPISNEEISLVVGNHMGFIDILCTQSIQPSVFVTSTEMKNTPILGQIAILGGACFVNRGDRSQIQIELKELIDVLKTGFRVGLFPEARASNGEQVLPFKKTLLTAAAFANVPIRPYVFNYIKINNREIKFTDRDSLCWYDDQTFASAIWKSLQVKSIVCEIQFLPLIFSKPEDDRTYISEQAHSLISEKFIKFHAEM